jgi:ATP synthase F1 epsilon subunit
MGLQVRVLTPDGIFIDTNAEELLLQTITGQIGVLPGHAPLLTALDIGPIIIQSNKTRTAMALIAGSAFVADNTVSILVNEAISSASINKRDAEKALEQAKNQLEQSNTDREKVEAIFAFKRAKARYQVVTLENLRKSFIEDFSFLIYVEIPWSTCPTGSLSWNSTWTNSKNSNTYDSSWSAW